MKKDKVAELKKEIRTYYLKKCLGIFVSVALVLACILLVLWGWYGILSSGYISDETNTLFMAIGKCSDVSYQSSGTKYRLSYYTFKIDGLEFRLYSKKITNYPESDTLENVLKNSEVTLQYVTGTSGINNVQSLQLSDGTIISDFEYVKKQNTINFVFACIMAPLFLLMTLPFCYGAYVVIVGVNIRIPSIKRKLERMEKREKMFSEQDTE